jgi:hypothetical protein
VTLLAPEKVVLNAKPSVAVIAVSIVCLSRLRGNEKNIKIASHEI